jgi:predicted Zn-dependent protease
VETLPEAFYGYVNLAGTYMLLGRLKDAKDTIRLAAARKVEHPFLAVERYQIGFIEGDQAAMEREAALSREKGALREWIASAESLTLAYSGHLQQARIASRHAADLAQHVGQRETAALFEVEEALREAFFGNATEAQRSITAALQFSKGRDVEYGAALALALSGQSLMAEKLADELEKRFPDDTEVRTTYVPEIRALLALNRNEPAKAVEALQVAVPYELGVPPTTGLAFFGALYPLYVRGEAWLAARDGVRAAAEFRRILDRRYVVVNDPIAALSHLQLGRALVLAGDENGAKRAYQDFLTLWKNAEGDIPILQRARAEYARLQ